MFARLGEGAPGIWIVYRLRGLDLDRYVLRKIKKNIYINFALYRKIVKIHKAGICTKYFKKSAKNRSINLT